MATDTTTALALDNPFWHYALHLWQQPGVEESCLQLQQQGLSVNRLLYCLWLADEGFALPADSPQADHWQQRFSHRQRALRFELRTLQQEQTGLEAAYKAMRAAELACEQVEIAWLYHYSHTAPRATAGPAQRAANLQQWLTRLDRSELWPHSAVQRLLTFTVQSPELSHSAGPDKN